MVNRAGEDRDRERRLAAEAEASVAERLRECGCDMAREIPTPSGRGCDFEVRRGGVSFFLHVKHRPPRGEDGTIRVPALIRTLEEVERPLLVGIRWKPGLKNRSLARVVTHGRTFLRTARMGDEHVVRDARGRVIAWLRVQAPRAAGSRVQLAVGLDAAFEDEIPRLQKLLRKAHQQFMPRGLNVIVIASERSADEAHVETALLGSMVERWDRFPRRGERVAHGRGDDGFWAGGRCSSSRVVAWLQVGVKSPRSRLWFREGSNVAAEARGLLEEIFGEPSG